MGNCCAPRRRRTNPTKVLGIILMIVGALSLMIFVPRWVWTGALSIVLISVGFLLWRFSE